jgi:hypothetical protein
MEHIDEHSIAVDAEPEQVWEGVRRTLRGILSGPGALGARALGCDPATGTATFEGRVGDAIPGFRVVSADAHTLALEGRHRFSHYRLTFLLGGGELRARTDADFPGLHGRLYRAAVIGSGGHRILTRRLLRQAARRA